MSTRIASASLTIAALLLMVQTPSASARAWEPRPDAGSRTVTSVVPGSQGSEASRLLDALRLDYRAATTFAQRQSVHNEIALLFHDPAGSGI